MGIATADLVDRYEGSIASAAMIWRDFGGIVAFGGPIRTVRCFRDNALVKAMLATPGQGAVLVIDGGVVVTG